MTALPLLPGTVALLSAAIGSTSFDGFSQSAAWQSIVTSLTPQLVGLGLQQETAFELAMSIGLAGSILVIGALYLLGVQGIRTVDRQSSAGELAGRFVHTLVPIAFAYLLAHYFSLLAYQGQATAFLISDPLGRGSNLFGTASARIDYNVITATGIRSGRWCAGTWPDWCWLTTGRWPSTARHGRQPVRSTRCCW